MAIYKPQLETVTTIKEDGSRRLLFPDEAHGKFTRARRLSGIFLIAVYALLPWIHINGHPAVFIDVLSRRFHLFGLTFVPQDMWLFFFLVTGWGFSIFFTTALLGRLWCGWICPQTVFLEHIYRPIERLIDGRASEQRRLDRSDWNTKKIIKRIIKHSAFLAVSFLIANWFLSYFISIEELYSWVTHSPTEHWPAFVAVTVVSIAIYGNFSRFREQLCMIICPYGRMQSVLMDEHSVGIYYDENRGEPRGRKKSSEIGDCVDCFRCVQVCPTGIDIRNGLQMECIGCAACIDACNDMMRRHDRPEGLIRYTSEESKAGRKTKWFRPRTATYLTLMTFGLTAMLIGFSKLNMQEMTVYRMPGAPFYNGGEIIRNQFSARLINKEEREVSIKITLTDVPDGLSISLANETVTLKALEEKVVPVILKMNKDSFNGTFKQEIVGEILEKDKQLSFTVSFLGPDKN